MEKNINLNTEFVSDDWIFSSEAFGDADEYMACFGYIKKLYILCFHYL